MSEIEDNFRQMGKHYGYPECCIDDFVNRTSKSVYHDTTDDQDKIHKNQGFIPCDKCSKRILSGEIKINDLITDRECGTPYPIDEWRH